MAKITIDYAHAKLGVYSEVITHLEETVADYTFEEDFEALRAAVNLITKLKKEANKFQLKHFGTKAYN